MTDLLTALGLTGPELFLTLGKGAFLAFVVLFLFDQVDTGFKRRISD